MAYNRTDYPSWSWSSSRKNSFDSCKRKYYFNYYLSHNGWEKDASEDCRKAYRLKNLTGIHLIFGTAMHAAAESICKAVKQAQAVPSREDLKLGVRDMLNKAWTDSKKNADKWFSQPSKNYMLAEFYYNRGISDDMISTFRKNIDIALDNLLNSETIRLLMSGSASVMFTENMDTFNFEETPVYAIPDLVCSVGDKVMVIDWKTGKENNEHAEQLNIYAMYLNQKHGIAFKDIESRIEYLVPGTAKTAKVSQESIDSTKQTIKKSIEEMRGLLEDSSVNRPMSIEHFPLAERKNLCPWCGFYEFCEEEIKKTS